MGLKVACLRYQIGVNLQKKWTRTSSTGEVNGGRTFPPKSQLTTCQYSQTLKEPRSTLGRGLLSHKKQKSEGHQARKTSIKPSKTQMQKWAQAQVQKMDNTTNRRSLQKPAQEIKGRRPKTRPLAGTRTWTQLEDRQLHHHLLLLHLRKESK